MTNALSSHAIQWKNLSAGYGKTDVLRNACLCAEAGHLTAIIGPNGCGKSTLLRTTLGILPSRSGEVRINGTLLSEQKRIEIARRVSYLSQGQNLPDMTVRQLVLHGRFPHLDYPRRYSEQDREIARKAMEKMGVSDLADAPLSTLSGGMRQNAYLAMALCQQSEYILLDEPTTYLDVAHSLSLMDILRQLSKDGHGIVAVLHDLPLALSFAHRVAVMHQGEIVTVDTPEAVAASGVIEAVMGISLYRPEGSPLYAYRPLNAQKSITC